MQGDEWGSAILQTNLKYKRTKGINNQNGRYVLPALYPIEVSSRWRKDQSAVSISQEVELSVRDMFGEGAAAKIVMSDVEHVDIVVRMCLNSGSKFKILSIACC